AESAANLQRAFPRRLVVDEARRVLAQLREEIRAGKDSKAAPEAALRESLNRIAGSSLRRVINATGVVLHTNLGRAPLPRFEPLFGYTNLEYDLGRGKRGKRDVHVSGLLERLAGAPGIAVNNNAAAIFLALHELATGHEVIVSRGELIEIGDGFRIPEIMRSSGAILREVGTTNRTRIADYRDAINQNTRLLMRVHPSNFRIEGFTGRPTLRELSGLARERGIPLYEDLGSGCVIDLRAFGIEEPLVQDSLGAGVNLVSFSGDKLLGGPQAGILAGDAELVERVRRNPMFRALRLDKLIYQALETTLRSLLIEDLEAIPALHSITQTPGRIRERAANLLAGLAGVGAELIAGQSVAGGGSTPGQFIETWLIAVTCGDVVEAERRCRAADPPVIARIEADRLLFDLRTVFAGEESELARTIEFAVRDCGAVKG
ncbi:MAG: L-seryl-tRNA(Sec) selenium transferase, partial [Bryobacteraceae bacterium]